MRTIEGQLMRAPIRNGNRIYTVSVRRHAHASDGIGASFQFESELLLDAYNTMLASNSLANVYRWIFAKRLLCECSIRITGVVGIVMSFDVNCHPPKNDRRVRWSFAKKGEKTTVVARERVFYFYPFRNLFELVEHTCSMFQLCWTRTKKTEEKFCVEQNPSIGKSANVFVFAA